MAGIRLGRREFGLGLISGLAATSALSAQSVAPSAQRISLPRRALGPEIPQSLSSLSYETVNLTDPEFFSPTNRDLIAAFRRLNPNGVLRLGGNTTDRAIFEGFDGVLPVLHPLHFNKGRIQPYYGVSELAIERLAGFLDATGWRVIFGINLRADSSALAAHMRDVAVKKLGDRLLAFQIGNEANNFYNSYDAYFERWKAVQDSQVWLKIAGPDSGANTDWVERFSTDIPQSILLSRHYYRGPAPDGSLADVLKHDSSFEAELASLMPAATRHPMGLWLTETNSYYYGGLDGVSNAFASTLWGLNFMLSAASVGLRGLCFHGGPRSAIDNSLEGFRTSRTEGANLEVAAARRLAASNYSPISGDMQVGFGPTPLFHAMHCVTQLAGARMFRPRGQSLT